VEAEGPRSAACTFDNAAIRGHRQQRLSDSLSGDGQRAWTMLTDPVKAPTTKHPVD